MGLERLCSNSLIASATTTSRNLTPAPRGCKIARKRVLVFDHSEAGYLTYLGSSAPDSNIMVPHSNIMVPETTMFAHSCNAAVCFHLFTFHIHLCSFPTLLIGRSLQSKPFKMLDWQWLSQRVVKTQNVWWFHIEMKLDSEKYLNFLQVNKW